MNYNNNNYNYHNNLNQMNNQNNINKLLNQIEELKKKNKKLEKEKNNIMGTYSELNEQAQNRIKNLENDCSKLQNSNLLLEKNKKNLEFKLQQKENDLKEKEYLLNQKDNLLNQKQNALDEANNSIEFYKKNLNEKNDQLYEKEIEIKSLKDQSNIQNSKFNGAINTFEDLRNEKEKLKNELSRYKEIEQKYNDIIIKNKRLNSIVNENEIKMEFLQKKAEEYYDVVIDIDSINSLKTKGWEIIYNKERKTEYDKIINDETMKIGVVGLNNVGKSYLLSKIVRVEIPTGYSVETKGISIKYAEKEKGQETGLCILDSAGHEAPLLLPNVVEFPKNVSIIDDKRNLDNEKQLEEYIKRDEEEELSKDKANTERFIERLIISLSDMIILVIGKLTRTEQRLINRIKEEAKNNEISRVSKIIVVHNLSQYHKIDEVKKHINDYLLHSATFKLEQKLAVRKNDRVFYVEKKSDKNENITVFHYIMAKEGTEAGDYYNNLCLELIQDQYNSFTNRERKNIPNEIINVFCELSTEIIGEKIDRERLKIIDNKIKMESQNQTQNEKTKFNFKNTYIDQDGKYLPNKEFEPKYSLYFYKQRKKNDDEEEDEEEYDNYLLLRLEIPGNITKLTARSTDPQKEKFRGIVITIHKNEDVFPEMKNEAYKKISDNRKYGKFAYFIELKKNLILSKTKAIGKTGIYQICFNDNNKEKEVLKEAPNDIQKKMANDSKNKEIEGKQIASGVYTMKFKLTQDSFNN